jgi:putative NIF3 family GTP cyclohydrolase 1 type 2
MRLAREGISVYCPHTAVDAVPGGMADWLCDIVTGVLQRPGTTKTSERENIPTPSLPNFHTGLTGAYYGPLYPRLASTPDRIAPLSHKRDVIQECPPLSIQAVYGSCAVRPGLVGFGRLVRFAEPQLLTELVDRIGIYLGHTAAISVAIPQSGPTAKDITITTIAICPGSGAQVVRDSGADLVVTGEMSHHDALAVTERGGCVITLFHSNSERGFLQDVMKVALQDELDELWTEMQEKEEEPDYERIDVLVSQVDRDPYGMALRKSGG